MPFRRMLPYLLLNIVVSAAVMLTILYWWENRNAEQIAPVAETAVTVTPSLATSIPEIMADSTAAPEEAPGDSPPIHVVKAGDTLGNISEFYDVPIDDIMTANGMDNPNLLSVGQELIIPVGGLPTPTPAVTELPPDILPSPIPTEEIETGGEVNVAITAVTGAGNLVEEAVQIANFGSSQIALLDWELSDSSGHVFTFSQVTLFGDGAAIQVHTEAGQSGPADRYWGLETSIWEPGEQATLSDAEGNIQATYIVP